MSKKPGQPQRHRPHVRFHAGAEYSFVRSFRAIKGWRQKDLAAAVGCKQVQISKIELGTIQPTAEMKRRIALALEVAVEEIFPDPAAAPAKTEDADAGR